MKQNATKEEWFKNQFNNWFNYVIPAYRLKGVECGRGRGGLVQLSKRNIAVSKIRVICSSKRIQAQKIIFPTCKIIWINSYLPCDSQQNNCDNTELIETLYQIEKILMECQGFEILWSGDLNWEMKRQTEFSKIMHNFVNKFSLKSAWQDYPADFTHIHTDGKSISVIDHFLLSPALYSLVESCKAVHIGDNLSRHSPIMLKLKLPNTIINFEPTDHPPRRPPNWVSAR